MLSPRKRISRALVDTLGSFGPIFRGAAAATKAVPPSSTRRSRGLNQPAQFEMLENRTLMSTYYISTSGSDSNNGTSSNTPWKSISKVNATTFKAGDNIYFQGGQTFGGGLQFQTADGGSSTTPVTVSSYGSGKATISSGGSDGALVMNGGGIWFTNLKFVGKPNGKNHDGIQFETVDAKRSNIRVVDCEITGYGFAGVKIMSDRSTSAYTDVQITGCNIHDNVDSGVVSYATARATINNVYIARNNVYSNYGDGTSYVTGNGLMLGGLNNAVVERNESYNNGWKGGNGGLGIWAYESNAVTFQYNESYNNHSLRGHDGGGFDFDADTSNSTMQYNYSHDNDGHGFQLNQWRNDSIFTNNTIRYNITQNDGRKNNYAGIEAWGKVLNSSFYNNTIYTSPSSEGGSPSGIKVHNSSVGGLYVSNVNFSNNIIIATGGTRLIYVPSAETAGAKNLKFTGNLYWTKGSSVVFNYGDKIYGSLSSLQSSTGQEKLNGGSTGVFADPKLNNAGGGGTIGNANYLASLTAYALTSSSPAINKGVNVSTAFSAMTPSKDYYGDSVSASSLDIGADEFGGTVASPPPTTTSGALPSGWSSTDIGSPGKTGSASYSSGTYTVTGGGTDIYGSSDQLRYAYTTLNGDGRITVKVNSTGNTDPWTKAGVMIRDGLGSNAKTLSMTLSPNGIALWGARSTTGGQMATVRKNSNGASWVRIIRQGSYASGYISTDGVNWTLLQTVHFSMNANITIGLAVTAHNNSTLDTAKFSNVTVVS